MASNTDIPNIANNTADETGKKVMDYAMVVQCVEALKNSTPENRNLISFLQVMFAQKKENARIILHIIFTDAKAPNRKMMRSAQMTHLKSVGNFKNILRRMGNSESDIASIITKNEAKYDSLIKHFAPSVGEDLTTYLVNKYFVLSDVF